MSPPELSSSRIIRGVIAEKTVRDLAELIVGLTGQGGELRWVPSMPEGQPRRAFDMSHAREAFGFVARTSYEDALRKTIAYYEGGLR